ncbi:hypothetical protein ABZP36_012990 [Zizania latifolia]
MEAEVAKSSANGSRFSSPLVAFPFFLLVLRHLAFFTLSPHCSFITLKSSINIQGWYCYVLALSISARCFVFHCQLRRLQSLVDSPFSLHPLQFPYIIKKESRKKALVSCLGDLDNNHQ